MTVSIDEVVCVNREHAAALLSVSVEGQELLRRQRGDAVVEDRTWKMVRSRFRELMRLAGVQRPPEVDQ